MLSFINVYRRPGKNFTLAHHHRSRAICCYKHDNVATQRTTGWNTTLRQGKEHRKSNDSVHSVSSLSKQMK